MEKPTTIFKFYEPSIQSLQNLKSELIYYGSSQNFNDPYDCAIYSGIAEPTDEELQNYKDFFYPENTTENGLRQFVETMQPDVLRNRITPAVDEKMLDLLQQVKDVLGVACFTEINNNLLMWAHYGDKYKGFCLEFSTNSNLFRNLKKVNYIPNKKIPKYDASKMILHNNLEQFNEMFCTKSEDWEYEKEWRAFKEKNKNDKGAVIKYELTNLNSIYFGPKVDPIFKDIACLILAEKNSNIRFWQGKVSKERFEVLFDEFQYTSRLEAKSKGLL